MQKHTSWKWKIETRASWLQWNLREIWQYKDLLGRLVRRDLIASYQQTVLGPLWIIIQPVLTTIVYWLIFSKIARISTEGVAPALFYLPGIIIWNYFSDCLNGTMYTFVHNSAMFNKVYFPRLIVPLSIIASHTIRMSVQLFLFAGVYVFYLFTGGMVRPSPYIFLLPLLVLLTAGFSLGVGLVISVVTAKYRDLDYALQFILRLFMFATPVVYPTSIVPPGYQFMFWLNPLTPIIETFRTVFFSSGYIHAGYLFISLFIIIIVLLAGVALFKKRELTVMDII